MNVPRIRIYPPGHPLQGRPMPAHHPGFIEHEPGAMRGPIHPGLPPHPLDGVPGAFHHTAPHTAPVAPNPHDFPYGPMPPHLSTLIQSPQGHDLPQSPVAQIGPVHLEGHSELPLMQPGAGVADVNDDGFGGRAKRQIVSPFQMLTPVQSRASSVTLNVNNLMGAIQNLGIFPIPLYTQAPALKAQVAQIDLEADDCAAYEIVFNVTQAPFHTDSGAPDIAFAVAWEVTYGYGGVTFIRNLPQQQGRIIVVGNHVRLSAYLIQEPNISVNIKARNTIQAAASGMIVPCIDGQLRSTTAWGNFTTTTGHQQIFVGPCTLWRCGGYVPVTTGGNAVFLWLVDTQNDPPTNGTSFNNNPALVIGEVPQGSEFSVDVSTSGFDFRLGVDLVASTTATTLTLDPGATICGDAELLIN